MDGHFFENKMPEKRKAAFPGGFSRNDLIKS